ncbi:hypothetical protein C7S18_11785 [Ahniella affigens]|uniref:Uncharacterized protein n=1 Tax=Ahniella affigens TaxID=2021234 RepID=A0A2P1PSK7_9GAMM|nr:hypothetical protein [Ahniella affigens]AVP97836.1 hypothetical protein C7S18_11785 [Ahniella affigens]
MSKQKTYVPRRRNWLRPQIFGREVPLYLAPLLIIGYLMLTHFLIRTEIQLWTEGFLNQYAWLGIGHYGEVDYDLKGRFVVNAVSLEPDSSDSDATIRVQKIEAEAPGLAWLVRTQLPNINFKGARTPRRLFLGTDPLPKADRFVIRFNGIDWGAYGSEFVLTDIDWIGPYSGALFEAAGCERDWWWHADDFADFLRLSTPSGNIEVQFEVLSDTELRSRVLIGDAETSQAIIDRRFKLEDAHNFLNADPESWRTIEVRWAFTDKGFIKARNRYCAEQAGISEPEFLERHLRSVERILQTNGQRWTDDVKNTYRRYATGQGGIQFETHFGKGIAWEDISHRSDAAVFTVMNGQLSAPGGPAVPYRMEIVPERAIPDDEDLDSIYVLVRREDGLEPIPESSATADSERPKSFHAKEAPPGDEIVKVKEQAYAEHVITSLPPNFDVPKNELPNYIGRLVQVDLVNGSRHRGIVEADAGEKLTLKIAAGAGTASLPLSHERIRRVTRLD